MSRKFGANSTNIRRKIIWKPIIVPKSYISDFLAEQLWTYLILKVRKIIKSNINQRYIDIWAFVKACRKTKISFCWVETNSGWFWDKEIRANYLTINQINYRDAKWMEV